jgi:RHS repeat-associated protein
MAYDKLGNIAYKSDVGYYEYSTSGSNPYKLVSINNKPPSINSFLQNVEYTSFNKVRYVSEQENGNIVHEMDLHYGVNKQRIKQVIDRHNTKIFVGNLYEKYISANETTEVFYIYSPDGLIAINTVTKNSNQLSVVLKDHLGSIQFIIDGNEFTEFSYDSYGSRRDPQTWLLLQNPVGFKLGIGFTGHEHLELFSIINMNGRIYDPVLGIFFTPDPLLQFPDLPIGLNPYSYCLNSPLSFVDPTGYSIDGFFFNFVRIMAMTVVTIGSGGNPLPAMFIATTFATMDGMHAMAKGANVSIVVDFILPSLVFTGTTAGIGVGIPSGGFLNELLRASAHGINNGVARMAGGGKFEHGFLTGFVSSLGSSFYN